MSNPKRSIRAWHFTDGMKLRDGQDLVVGKTYVYDGEPEMCKRGYHASKHVFDAFKYAPGTTLSLVECSEITERGVDKFVCRRRKVVKTIDVADTLREFARWCALRVIDLWNAPEVVVRYLKTGDESLRDTARAAARAALAAARAAARDAQDASGIARDASAAARAAVLDAVRDAAFAAAQAAVLDVSAAARDAPDAAWAASVATWAAEAKKQRAKFARMINRRFKDE